MNLISSIPYLGNKLSGRGTQPDKGKSSKKPAAKKVASEHTSTEPRLGQKLDISA
jgi:hypothetical protein